MTKETKDLGAAPPRSLTEDELHDMERSAAFVRAAYGPPDQEVYLQAGEMLSLISDLRSARDRLARMEAAIRWVTGEQPLADGRWFDEREFGHERSGPRYWWRSVLRRFSGIDDETAPQPPPDSSAALLEARRLLGEAHAVLAALRAKPDDVDALLYRVWAFLWGRSDSERSEPARSESEGSKVVHDPSEEGR